MCIRDSESFDDSKAAPFFCSAKRKRRKKRRFKGEKDARTVSYTHLDVYKRQPQCNQKDPQVPVWLFDKRGTLLHDG